MTFYLRIGLSSLLLLASVSVRADYFDAKASYQVYFTPTHNCTNEIVYAIQKAKYTLYVQAYFLTSEPIISALLAAKSRQVDVKVIVDKNHPENAKGIQRMLESDIPVWIDKSSGIAHNKIMVIDEQKVVTGSFNFTYSAQHRNRENILLITDRGLAKHYVDNWYRCQIRATEEAPLRKRTKKAEVKQNWTIIDELWAVLARLAIICSALWMMR